MMHEMALVIQLKCVTHNFKNIAFPAEVALRGLGSQEFGQEWSGSENLNRLIGHMEYSAMEIKQCFRGSRKPGPVSALTKVYKPLKEWTPKSTSYA